MTGQIEIKLTGTESYKILQKLSHVNNKSYKKDNFSPVFDNPGSGRVFGAT